MTQLVLASGNRGKLQEIRQLIAPLSLNVIAQSELGIDAADETGLTFVENAILKARHASAHSQSPALADDSGIEVDCLQGAPGIYSARYAGPNASDQDNRQQLLEALANYPDASCRARYQCVIAVLRHSHDPTPLICQASWEGMITLNPRGEQGFGYDPLFYLPELDKTAAQLDPQSKNRLSHRGQALQQLLTQLPSWLGHRA